MGKNVHTEIGNKPEREKGADPHTDGPAVLRRKEPEFHQVYAQLNGNATVEVDPESRTVKMNSMMPQLLGTSPDRVQHARILDFFAPEDQERLRPLLKEPPEGPVHLTGLTADCKTRGPVEVDVTLVPLQHDPHSRSFLIIHDTQGPAATIDHSSAYRELLDHSTDSAIMTDMQGNLCIWNLAAARLFGWTKQEAVGKNALQLLFVEEDPDVNDLIRSIRTGTPWRRDCLMQRKSGETFMARVEAGPILDHQERPMGMFAVCRDRIHELTVQELGLKKARLISGGDPALKQRFMDRHRVIHQGTQEAKNPLTSMRLQLDLLDNELPYEKPRRIRRTIVALKRNLERTNHLLDLMVDAATMERHGLELYPDRAYLDDLVRELLQDFVPPARKRQIRIVLDIDPNVMIWGDVLRLSQAFTMILTNALECTPPGGTIGMTARRKNDETEIQITDTGIGLDHDELRKIFRPFPPMTRKTPMSSGLSLYIAKGVVEAHRGSIRCDSPGPGKGTRFTIVLPAEGSVEAIPQ